MPQSKRTSSLVVRVIDDTKIELVNRGMSEEAASNVLEWILVKWEQWAEVDKKLQKIDELLAHTSENLSEEHFVLTRDLLIDVVRSLCPILSQKKTDFVERQQRSFVSLSHSKSQTKLIFEDCQLEKAINIENDARQAEVNQLGRFRVTSEIAKLRRKEPRIYAALLCFVSGQKQRQLARNLNVSDATASRLVNDALVWLEEQKAQVKRVALVEDRIFRRVG